MLEILQAVQGEFGYLPKEGLERVCELTEISPAAIAGVSTFYNQFRHCPAGQHIVNICVGTACHVKGAQQIYDAFKRRLKIPDDDDTDAERLFTIEKIACLGCCTLAPAVQIGQITYGHLTPDSVGTVLSDYLMQEKARAAEGAKAAEEQVADVAPGGEIRIGLGSCCVARGSGKLQEALDEALRQTGINVPVKRVGCVGMCYQTPLLEIVLPGDKSFLYAQVEPKDARAIVLRHFKMPGIKRRISSAVSGALDSILSDRTSEPVTRHSIDVREGHVADFLGKQVHIATEHCGVIDPIDLDEYLSKGGFEALRRCIDDIDAEQTIAEIEKSGLRGRGGGGLSDAPEMGCGAPRESREEVHNLQRRRRRSRRVHGSHADGILSVQAPRRNDYRRSRRRRRRGLSLHSRRVPSGNRARERGDRKMRAARLSRRRHCEKRILASAQD